MAPASRRRALTWVAVDVFVGDVVVVVDVLVVDVLVVDVEEVEEVDEVDEVEEVDEVGPVSVPKRMVPTARSPAWSPMARTQVSPAACCVGVGGHGNFAASVAPLPEVLHPVMTDVLGVVWVHVGVPVTGGPTVPVAMVCVPVRTPVPEMFVSAKGEQLTGMSLPRNKIWGCVGSELHCSMEASELSVKCAPLAFTMSPLANPLQTGAVGTELLHVTPAAVEVSFSVGAVAALLTPTTFAATMVPPAITATTPNVVISVITRVSVVAGRVLPWAGLSLQGPLSSRWTRTKEMLSRDLSTAREGSIQHVISHAH